MDRTFSRTVTIYLLFPEWYPCVITAPGGGLALTGAGHTGGMTGIAWTSFLPAAFLVSLVPGANQLLSLRNAIRHGTRQATVALAGRFAAFGVLVAVVAVGLGTLLTRSAPAFEVVKWAGVAYLTWLGASTLRRTVRDRREDTPTPDEPAATRGQWSLVRQEFAVAITNPKALLLFAAFLPQFAPAGTTAGPQLAVLGAAYIGIEAVSAIGYTLLGGRLQRLDLTRRAHRRIDRLSAASFLGLAGYLAAEQRP